MRVLAIGACVGLIVAAACSAPSPSSQPASAPPSAGAAPVTSAAPAPAAAKPLTSAFPADLPANPTPIEAVVYAWDSFISVNWPAQAGLRGVPDPSKTIGQPGPVVWQTWKAPEEIFAPDGSAPAPWPEYGGALPPQCSAAGATAAEFSLRRLSKAPSGLADSSINQVKQAVGGTLTDQHGNLARYDVRMNRTIFDAVVAGQYYNREGQDRAPFISLPSGVTEVKASWRIMTPADSPDVRSRFFRATGWIYTPPLGTQPATCVQGEVGLVGLHIATKTATRPQWTWATFEHVDNVPPAAPGWNGPLSFNNPSCPAAQCPPNQSTEKNGVPTTTPTQVTRIVPIGSAAAETNPLWQQAFAQAVPGSPFQYYQLIDVQYPQRPSQKPDGAPTPGLVSNTTMETYVTQSSCLNCHYTAQTASGKLSSDFTFMLAEAASSQGRAGR